MAFTEEGVARGIPSLEQQIARQRRERFEADEKIIDDARGEFLDEFNRPIGFGEFKDSRPEDGFDPPQPADPVFSGVRFTRAALDPLGIELSEGEFGSPREPLSPSEEKHEEKKQFALGDEDEPVVLGPITRLSNLFENALEHVAESKGPEIAAATFNRENLAAFFDREFGGVEFVQAGIERPPSPRFISDFEDFIDDGLNEVAGMEDTREGFHAFLRTIVNAVPLSNPPIIREIIENRLEELPGVPGLRADVADMLDEILPENIAQILRDRTVLTPEQLTAFEFFFNQQIEDIDKLGELNEWREYIGSHLGSGILRVRLLDLVNEREMAIQPPDMGAVVGGPEEVPFLKAVRTGVLQNPEILAAAEVLTDFERKVKDAMERKEPDFEVIQDEKGVEIGRIEHPLVRRADKLVATYNRGLRRHNVRDGEGEPVQISLLGPRGLDSFLRAIRNFQTSFKQKGSYTFDIGPQPGKAQDVDSLLRGLETELMRTRTSSGSYVTHPEKVTMMGNIEIAKESMAVGAAREITIPPTTRMNDLVVLAMRLSMEGGWIETMDGRHVLRLEGTSIGTIVSFMQELLDMSGGKEIKFLYFPPDKGEFIDGMFQDMVGGSLNFPKPIRFLMGLPVAAYTKYGGGVKVSDIAGTVGSVAGSVGDLFPPAQIITAPIKAVSNIVKSIGKLFKF